MNQPFVNIPVAYAYQPQPQQIQEPPPRVRAAMQLLEHFYYKTMTRIGVNDVGFQEVNGQELKPVEEHAQAAACNLLIDYFHGHMEPDAYDIAHRPQMAMKDGKLMACPLCVAAPSNSCAMCSGSGRVVFYPVREL